MKTMKEIYAANTMTYEELASYGISPMASFATWDGTQVEDETDDEREERRERYVIQRMREAGVPERFIGAEADTSYDLTHGNGVILFGKQGSGKTTKAAGIVKGWLMGNVGKAQFVTSADLLTEIGATYSGNTTELSVIRKYGKCGLLVIDDLGKENPTDQTLTKLWQVIDTRYGAMLPTVITTQHDLGELVRELGRKGGIETAKAIASRLYETCQPVSLGNVDHRRRNS
jgi:DNA replication protein DnaC/primosomal protein DnaI